MLEVCVKETHTCAAAQQAADIKVGHACQPAAPAEGQVRAVVLAKSDDYLPAKDNRPQLPPARQAEGLSRDAIKNRPPREMCGDCGGPGRVAAQRSAALPVRKEGRTSHLQYHQATPARQIGLVCEEPPTWQLPAGSAAAAKQSSDAN